MDEESCFTVANDLSIQTFLDSKVTDMPCEYQILQKPEGIRSMRLEVILPVSQLASLPITFPFPFDARFDLMPILTLPSHASEEGICFPWKGGSRALPAGGGIFLTFGAGGGPGVVHGSAAGVHAKDA